MATSNDLITVLSVDDHPIFREGIAALIATQPDMELVGDASSGIDAVAQYRAKRPDIVLMDVQMPTLNGIDAIRAIRDIDSNARIIVLTTYAGDVLANRALKAGAQAYLLKGMVRTELLATIRDVQRGKKHVTPDVAAQIATHAADSSLTSREVEVLQLIAAGNSNKLIAHSLAINEGTVKGHVKNILAKLGANDRTHAVSIAVRRGIIDLEIP